MGQKVLLNAKEVNIILHRLACQLIENHNDFSQTVLIGIQPRGVFLAKRLTQLLKEDYAIENIQSGLLDITFFRDDFRRSEKLLEANTTEIDFVVENKNVVFIDDFDLAAPLGSLVSISFQLNFQLLQSIGHLPSGLGHLQDVLLMLLVHLCVLAKDFFHLTL